MGRRLDLLSFCLSLANLILFLLLLLVFAAFLAELLNLGLSRGYDLGLLYLRLLSHILLFGFLLEDNSVHRGLARGRLHWNGFRRSSLDLFLHNSRLSFGLRHLGSCLSLRFCGDLCRFCHSLGFLGTGRDLCLGLIRFCLSFGVFSLLLGQDLGLSNLCLRVRLLAVVLSEHERVELRVHNDS